MENNGITRKGFFGRLFCRHKNKGQFKERSKNGFECISGDTVLTVCKDCGKVIGKTFLKYEGMGYK